MRVRYDRETGRRLKTVELIVESIPWQPRLRERAKRLGAVWRPAQKLWEITWANAKRLGFSERVAKSDT